MFASGIYSLLMVDVASAQEAEREMRRAIARLRLEFAVLHQLESKASDTTAQEAPRDSMPAAPPTPARR
ncbi:MAG TPA: hypothetical protein VFW83_10485 [Bryobacteraceae bacterium]|nr:hypothetical protein [Bryobacteraceae bacterium]